jgi:uncharacterized protein YktA (UPF0223 family)
MATKNVNNATINASYVVNATNGEIKVVVSSKKEEKKTEKTVAAFAKNTRYSIYNNGGGYTGL